MKGRPLLYLVSKLLLKLFLLVIINYFWITIKMTVIKSKNAKKYSINAFSLLFLTKFQIDEPKAAHGDIDNGQMIRAIAAIYKIEKIKFSSLGKKPDAAILEIVHAFGFTI